MKFVPCLIIAILFVSCEKIFPGLPDCSECPPSKTEWVEISFYGIGTVEKKYENCYSPDFGHAIKINLLNSTPLGTRKILLYNVPENMIQKGKWINFRGKRLNEEVNKIYCDKDTVVTEQYYVSQIF